MRTLGGIFLAFGILVSTHQGEFWPFSIYPMFSQAGKPWTRSLVRDVTGNAERVNWQPVTVDELPGQPFAMDKISINQNDVSNFIQKAGTWTPQKVNGMRRLFEESLAKRSLLLMRVQGRLDQNDDTVQVSFTPYMLMTADTTILNPGLITGK